MDINRENTDYFSREKLGFIYELYVFPEYRGRGLSRELMEAGIKELKEVFRNSVECICWEFCKRDVRRVWVC